MRATRWYAATAIAKGVEASVTIAAAKAQAERYRAALGRTQAQLFNATTSLDEYRLYPDGSGKLPASSFCIPPDGPDPRIAELLRGSNETLCFSTGQKPNGRPPPTPLMPRARTNPSWPSPGQLHRA